MIAFPRSILMIFTRDPEVLAVGVACLRTISYGYAIYAWGMVMVQAFNGAGDTLTPTWINFLSFWVLEIPLAWVLARTLGMGPTGVFVAILVAESVMTAISLMVFRRGAWKTRSV